MTAATNNNDPTWRMPGSQSQPINNHKQLRRASVSTTVAKAINILDILAAKAEAGISLAELCALIDIPKSSTHRYLVTLQELGLAERKSNDRYTLGTKIIEMAGTYLLQSDLRNDSQPVLDELAELTGETIHLAVPSGTEVVYIAKVESKHALSMYSHIGARLPMHCTALGKAILAFSDRHKLQAVLAAPLVIRTPNSITLVKALEDELTSIRKRGYAIDNEENEIGIRCIGAPIFDYTTKPVGAISVSAPSDRMDPERCNTLGPLLLKAAQKVSRRKGYAGQVSSPKGQVESAGSLG
jgi:IclR family acetate operon transcriptional repressor